MKKQCMVLLVDNNSGVLARIASLFMQRGFNIDSLTVSPTEIPSISRLTIMTTGDQKTFSQIMKQTSKLVETKMIFSVEPSFSLIRELLLVKFSAYSSHIKELQDIVDKYGAKVVDMTNGCFAIELTDSPEKIDAFLEEAQAFELVEMCRSGAIAMERGNVSYEI